MHCVDLYPPAPIDETLHICSTFNSSTLHGNVFKYCLKNIRFCVACDITITCLCPGAFDLT